jgi:hypothetical protein
MSIPHCPSRPMRKLSTGSRSPGTRACTRSATWAACVVGTPVRAAASGGGFLKPAPHCPGGAGRMSVVLYKNHAGKTRLVHQLVLEAFVGPRPPGMDALHGPGRHLDNRLVNLSWGSKSKNCGEDRVRDGTSNRGERAWQHKLTTDIVQECRRRYVAGERVPALAREFEVSPGAMSSLISGRIWSWLPGGAPNRPPVRLKGEEHHAAKLTAEIVLACRARAAAGESQTALAREFGVRQPTMNHAITGYTWKHL